jgi:hypothetical protein
MKAPDVKKEELAYTGLDDFLRDKPNVTKQEVQDFLANNRVEVQEVTYGKQDFSKLPDTQLQDEYVRVRGYKPVDNYGDAMSREEIISELSGAMGTDLTQYGKYQLAGGENYREILLTLPEAKPSPSIEIQKQNRRLEMTREIQDDFAMSGDVERAAKLKAKADAIEESIKELEKLPIPKQTENYQSSHFDQPNILAHMRVNDRIDADGKKMLLVEEIQSDWHQAGRERGYSKSYKKEDVKPYTTEQAKSEFGLDNADLFWYFDVPDNKLQIPKSRFATQDKALNYVLTEKKTGGDVPDAPFKDTWYQLALKRLTKYAADNGYERIGLTTGKQQASRFDLSKQVDEIAVPMVNEDGSRSVRIDPTSGTSIKLMVDDKGIVTGYGAGSTQFSGKKLSEVIGKDIADKVMKADADTKFTGLDLQVGGEGMKKYYDEIYPKFLDKYGKKYGASVGETQITTDYARDASGIPAQRPSKETIRYLDITPQMKEGTSKGQPLFAATPLLPATSLLDEEKRKEITSLLE